MRSTVSCAFGTALVLGTLALLLMAAPASALTTDGDLTDLKTAVLENLNSSGLRLIDECGDIGSPPQCQYFPNGADIDTGWVYVDFSNPGGTLWIGFEQCGIIGDADGDLNADTFTNTEGPGGVCPPVSGDDPGIGPEEQYLIQIDTNCGDTFVATVTFAVASNDVFVKQGLNFIPIDGASFNPTGTDITNLEVMIPNLTQLLMEYGEGFDPDACHFAIKLRGGFLNDGLAEDDSPAGTIFIPGAVSVTKTPPEQSACAGTEVSWLIEVCNEGNCPLDSMIVTDVLDAGLSYVSDTQGGEVDGQVIRWVFTDVQPDQCFQIDLTAALATPCVSPVLRDSVHVLGVKEHPCLDMPEEIEDYAVATVNCLDPDVEIIKDLDTRLVEDGEAVEVTLTVRNTGSSVLDPVTVTDQLDEGVLFDDTQVIGGSCGATVASFENGLITFADFTLGIGQECTIIYTVVCGEPGEHPDLARVVAYCQGTYPDNPVDDEDDDSFVCKCIPDVDLDKNLTPRETTVGGSVIEVELTVQNTGTSTLDSVVVTDQIDEGTFFDDGQTIGGDCGTGVESFVNGLITFTPFSLPPGETCTITYEVACLASGARVDTARVIAYCEANREDFAEDMDFDSYDCGCVPEVDLEKDVSPNTTTVDGGDLEVTLTITNDGMTLLDSVVVTDQLDEGTYFDDGQTISGDCGTGVDSYIDGLITFEPFSLGSGESCTISYVISCATVGEHPDTARVIAYCEGNRDDYAEAEDYDSYDCGCIPEVELDKDLNIRSGVIGENDKIQVTLTIVNAGNTLLDSVSVTDQLDGETYFDDAQTVGGTCGVDVDSYVGGLITFTPFSLGPGEDCTIIYEVMCTMPGEHPDTARVIAYCEGNRDDYATDEDYDSHFCDCIPDVEFDKDLSTRNVGPGDEVEVTLSIRNAGSTALYPITVCDKLDVGTTFDETQQIGGSCEVGLAGAVLNPDDSITICFEEFQLDPGESCTIVYRVACGEAGDHPDTATVVAYCAGNLDLPPDRETDYDSYNCFAGGSCPRTPGFWTQQCAQKGNGSEKFNEPDVTKIAECVDENSAYFNWADGTDFAKFCEMINPERPMNQEKQLKRHFAALLANYCTGVLVDDSQIPMASNGATIKLDLSSPIDCPGVDAETIGELVGEIDSALMSGDWDKYGALLECADRINNGVGIPPAEECAGDLSYDRRAGSDGRTDLDTNGDLGGFASGDEGMEIAQLKLYSATPNPFNHTTRIAYAVKGGTSERVDIGIYNVAGKLVRRLVSGLEAPGYHEAVWDGRSDAGAQVRPGVYFLRAFVGPERINGSRILYLQ